MFVGFKRFKRNCSLTFCIWRKIAARNQCYSFLNDLMCWRQSQFKRTIKKYLRSLSKPLSAFYTYEMLKSQAQLSMAVFCPNTVHVQQRKKTRTHSQNPSLNSSSKSLLHWYYNPWYYNLKMNVLYLYVYFSEFNLYSLSGTTANVHAVFVCLIQRFLPSWSNV